MSKIYKKSTKCVQSGYEPKNGEPRVLPLYQSTTYKYDDADEVGMLFDLQKDGHMYSRISNPTVAALEAKIADLEGGIGAIATSSGQSATMLSILTICTAGGHILAMSNLYGGTYTLLSSTMKKMGIEVTFMSPNASDDELQSAIRENTKLVFGETIGNPGISVLDIEKIADFAHRNNIPLIIDNTLPTPVLCNPFEYGADIIIHSTTKYIDGHASCVGGMVVDSGNFNWENGKFPELTEPDSSYHGLSYTKSFGELAYLTKARAAFIRDIGNYMSPFNAYLTNFGCETLALRMERHSENALKVAKFLEAHELIDWINYPLLESSSSYELAKKYLPNGASGIISFGIKGGLEAGKKFINSLKLASLVVHLGDVRTHVLHPASMTHRQLSEKEQLNSGVSPEMVRLSVGIESAEDIIADLKAALELLCQ